MMMNKFITSFFAMIVMLILLQHQLVASVSPNSQKIALFQFKQSLTIRTPTSCNYFADYDIYFSSSHPKTMNWSMSSDYCTWEGVSCDLKTGNVIGLDLSCSQLEGAILPNSTLFQLSHLQFLNLFGNDFSLSKQFPQEFGFFAKGLTHLNLSQTGFTGTVPSRISHLYKLVSLDLSDNYVTKLEDEVFKSLLQNLTQLRVLNLEIINISSVFPLKFSTSLRVLNLGGTRLQGVLPEEVFHFPYLKVLDLSYNRNLRATLPKVKWGSSATLQHLSLTGTDLHGVVHEEVFNLPNLKLLDLHTQIFNLSSFELLDLPINNLTATLPKVKWGSSATLQYLDLGGININGSIPDSIGFLESLVALQLYYCNLSGPIPESIGNLGQLSTLDLGANDLNGPILTFLANLTNLKFLILSHNNFTGFLHHWLFQHPSLETLDLAYNGFTGQLHEFDYSKSQLQFLECSNNQLNGSIPQSFSQLVNLTKLDISSNNFSGVLDFQVISLRFLRYLDLSYNSLSVRNVSMVTLPPQISYLRLSSCKIKEFPHFSRNTEKLLDVVDLSNNDINGEIPHWIGSLAWSPFSYLNLSYNRLTGGLEQLPWNDIEYLDLRYNSLNGSLPSLICNSSSLQILDLSYNKISGELPDCSQKLTSIQVFDLQKNKIWGNIPAGLSNFCHLETLNLNGNKLVGRIPSSFADFDYLKVLDLGNNHINDTFPQCLEALPDLQVLILKSNKFHGIIGKSSKVEHPFPKLRIIDLSYNEFSGPLPAIYFRNLVVIDKYNIIK